MTLRSLEISNINQRKLRNHEWGHGSLEEIFLSVVIIDRSELPNL